MKIVSILIVLILSPFFLQAEIQETTNVKIDKLVPDFTLMDVDGNKHSLSDYFGKYIVLEWINFDCPFVKKHYKSDNMQTLQSKYTSKEVVWLSICSSAKGKQGYFESDEIKKLLSDYKANVTAYLIDQDGTVGKMFQAKTTPHIYIISPNRKLIYAGAIDNIPSVKIEDIKSSVNYIDQVFDAVYSGKPVSTKSTKPYGCSVKYMK